MTDSKASAMEAEIEAMRHSRMFVGIEEKLAKYKRKFAPSGCPLEYLIKAEILLNDIWMQDDQITFDHWIPKPTIDKSMLEALPLLKKAQMSKEKSDIDFMSSKVKKSDV
jgi:hypothetical protein